MRLKVIHTFQAALAAALTLIGVLNVSTSRAQVAVWAQVYPRNYDHSAIAFDVERNVTVLVGGVVSATPDVETWTWNGSAWTLHSVSGPSARTAHAMAYDVSRGVTVLFGGDTSELNGETWEFNGTAWTQVHVPGPSPRSGHAMVYDSVLHRTILFGGLTSSGSSTETWAFDGSSWTLLSSIGPSARYAHAMAFDSDRNVAVLFGGTTGAANGETWEWDGTSWMQRQSSGALPSPRTDLAMFYDSSLHKTVLFGGKVNGSYVGQTYEWDGSGWRPRPVLSNNSFAAAAFDSHRNVAVLFAGQTVERAGTVWSVVARLPSGPVAMAFDSVRNITINIDIQGITSGWNGVVWTQLATGTPSGALVFDSARSKSVLLGNGQTWELDTSGWTRREVPSPSQRSDHRMAYDSARGVTVLFGGTHNLNDTWEWDGSSWNQRLVPGPSGRQHHAMAYDSRRHVTVLFGGFVFGGSPALLADTWEWDGTSWTQRLVSGPPAQSGHAMSYDSARGVCVLFGGTSQQTWEWDGNSWIQRLTHFPNPSAGRLAYDSLRHVTVLAGSGSGSFTREYGSPCSAPLVTTQPTPQSACRNTTATFTIAAAGSGQLTYAWRRDSQILDPDVNASANTPTLMLSNVQSVDAGLYDCIVHDDCSVVVSDRASLSVCAADYNCDQFVNFFDYLDFVQAFTDADPSADFNNDSVIDFFDYLDFVQAFSTGC